MPGMVSGIALPMWISALSGFAMLAAVATLLYLVTYRKMPMRTHRLYALTLAGAFLLHALWGAIAVFVLQS
jgi:hypothetical protein